MYILFILSQVFFLAKQNEYKIITDALFGGIKENSIYSIISDKQVNNFYYKGRPQLIEKINDYKSKANSAIYINREKYFSDIPKFPKSTIFLINKSYIEEIFKYNINNYYFIVLNNFSSYYLRDSTYFYDKVSSELSSSFKNIVIYFLIIFSIFLVFFKMAKSCSNEGMARLYVSYFANNNICFVLLLAVSSSILKLLKIFYIIYPIYKAYFIVEICYLLNGYSITYSNSNLNSNKKACNIFIFEIIEIILSLIFIYIVYLLPSLDNFYLFFAKSLIEHIIIIVFGVKMFLKNFIRLYKHYRIERTIRTILTITYKYKLLLYSKVFIFCLFYCLGFIVLDLIQIIYKINTYNDGSYYIYYMNVSLELFFNIILNIVFYPISNPLLLRATNDLINLDLDNITFMAEIKTKKEIIIGINNLNKKLLKDKYLKNEYPIVLIEPFAKSNNLFNDKNIHIGIVRKS